MDDKLKALMDGMPIPRGEPIKGKTYIADGWQYRDLPRMSHEMFDKFAATAGGEANLVWLTIADYGTSIRGQVLISPDGMRSLAEFKESAVT